MMFLHLFAGSNKRTFVDSNTERHETEHNPIRKQSKLGFSFIHNFKKNEDIF